MIVKGFWHLYLVNNWKEIVNEQLQILMSSGLYERCDEINIGCIGSREQFLIFSNQKFITSNIKFRLRYFSEKSDEFEFPTLHLIEQDNTDYIGFYFHLKGVTRPEDDMQRKERWFLNEMMLNQWRSHYHIIETGYDVSSLSYLTIPKRFSGNYWWFHRQRLSRLPALAKLDHKDRFNAEKWIYSKK